MAPWILLQNSLKFLDYLEKQGKIQENDLTFLEELCKKVTPSLTRIIEKYIEEKGKKWTLGDLHPIMRILKTILAMFAHHLVNVLLGKP